MSAETVDFVAKAITMIAKHGWRLLPQVRAPYLSVYSHGGYKQAILILAAKVAEDT